MKETGMIRRLDDLGRVVIPKEIRTSLHLDEGDPMEILVDDKSVVFRKYNPLTIGREICRAAENTMQLLRVKSYAIYDCTEKLTGTGDFPKYLPVSIRDIPKVDLYQYGQNILIAPIQSGGELYGCLAAYAKDEEHGSENELTGIIKALASMIAQVIT